MAGIYGRRTAIDDFIDASGKLASDAGSAGISAVKQAVPATKKAIRGIGDVFSNTIGNNGRGGSGTPTYVADPYSADPEKEVPLIANAQVAGYPAVPAIQSSTSLPADNGVGVGYRDPAKVVPIPTSLNRANANANADRNESLTASGFTMTKDGQGNEVWQNVSGQEPAQAAGVPVKTIPSIAAPIANSAVADRLQQSISDAPQVRTIEEYKRRAEQMAPALWTDRKGQANQMAIAGQLMAADQVKNKTYVDQQKGVADIGMDQQKVANINQLGNAEIDGRKYGIDKVFEGNKYAADQRLEGDKLTVTGRVATAVANNAADTEKLTQKQQEDRSKHDKEREKEQQAYAEKFLADAGAERSPENMTQAIVYGNQFANYNRKADTFIDRLPEQSRMVWADILKRNREGKLTKEESNRYAPHLVKAGLLEFPKRPAFTPKSAGMVTGDI